MAEGSRDPRLEDARARALAELEVRHAGREIAATEYERRAEAIRAAASLRDLEASLRASDLDGPPVPLEPGELHLEDERRSIVSILTGVNRRGSWQPPATLQVVSLMGGVNLDFRKAEFLEGIVTEVVVTSIMGGVNILIPPGADVDSDGFAIMGEFTHLSHRSPNPDSPAIRVRGFSLMGGVNVKVKK